MTSRLGWDLAGALDPAVTFRRAVGGDPERWQRNLLYGSETPQAVLCARQVGKSVTVGCMASHTAAFTPGSLTLIFSPSQRQSDELLAKVRHALQQVAAVDGNATEIRTESGSRVVSLPATESTTRGYSAANLLIFDEAARIPDDTFTGAMPMAASGGRVIALSTPGARLGWFWEAWQGERPGWHRIKVMATDSAQYTPARIEALRAALGDRQYRAELLCEFVGVVDSVFNPDDIERAFDTSIRPLFGAGVA